MYVYWEWIPIHMLMLVCGYTDSLYLENTCNPLLESSRNHILTIKHLRITVGGYTYGLPRFLVGILGHGIQPIRYRILKRMDSFNLSRANLWVSIYQNNIPEVSFKLLYNISGDIFEL